MTSPAGEATPPEAAPANGPEPRAAPASATTPDGTLDSGPRVGVIPWRRELLGSLLLYLMLAFLFTWNTWQDPANRWVGHCCDQQQTMWFLAWTPTALEMGQSPLLTDRLNAPAGANLMWNSAAPLLGLVYSPLTRGLGPILAYNIAVLLAIAFSGVAAYAALRRYSSGPLGPLVGAALYALSPFVASHATLHLQLINVWAPPLFLLVLDEILVRRRRRPELLGVVLGLLGAVQLLVFEEFLATSAIAGLLLVLVIGLVVWRRAAAAESVRRLLRAAGPGLAAFLLIAGYPLLVQFFGPQQVQDQLQPPSVFSTDLLNIVVPTDYTLLAPDAATVLSDEFSGLHHEATGYIGVPMLLLLAWLIVWRRGDPRVITAAVMALALLLLSLGPELHVNTEAQFFPLAMPWQPLADLPVIEHALPGRLTLYMYLAIAVLVTIGADEARRLPARGAAIRLAAIGLAVVTLAPAPAKTSASPVPMFFTAWERQGIGDDQVVLVAPWFTNGAGADPMLWAAFAEARPRMYEGYVYVPDAQGRPRYGPPPGRLARIMMDVQDHGTRPVLSAEDRAGAVEELRKAGVSVLIVGPLRHRDEMVELFTNLLGSPPADVDGVQLWRDVQASISGG